MKKIIYDGSFNGFLNALEKAVSVNAEEISSREEEELFSEEFLVKTDAAAAAAFRRKTDRISGEVFRKIQLMYLSEAENFENFTLGYVRNMLEHGASAENFIQDRDIARTDKLCRSVLGEAHMFKGFIRFSELENGLMFSKISPDHNILPLLRSHFRTRFGRLNFIIYDEKRNKAIVNGNGRCEMVEISDVKFRVSENEKATRELWKDFFKTIAIKERSNPKLQRSFVPLKYRRNITEFE